MPVDKMIEAGLMPETENFGQVQINELVTVLNQLRSMQL